MFDALGVLGAAYSMEPIDWVFECCYDEEIVDCEN